MSNQRISDQMRQLERGARTENPSWQSEQGNGRGGPLSHGGLAAYYSHEPGYDQQRTPEYDELLEQPMNFDAFDEQLLQQPTYNQRPGQAAPNRSRSFIPPDVGLAEAHDAFGYDDRDPGHYGHRGQAFDSYRYAPETTSHGVASSSSDQQHLLSSPTHFASQRRFGSAELYGDAQLLHDEVRSMRQEQHSHNRPVDVERRGPGQLLPDNRPLLQTIDAPAAPARRLPPSNASRSAAHGIDLVATRALPDRLRTVFPFPVFNAVQSKCFGTLYETNDNFVLSAPTGSGKTAVLELAICRLICASDDGSYKVIYQAPTKSLCAERQRDWQSRFGPLGLQCVELTGDTDNAHLRTVQHASIIVTTPEKWDSITRKWKDHQRLMQMVKLFLIDEVHLLKEERGATLEAVVSRMKSVGSDVRFVALSATVPNLHDIAIWLGRTPTSPASPAMREKFGEDFRPVRLQKHVCGYQSNLNDFAFEKSLNSKVTDVIAKWSQQKPIMVFCFTRNACLETAVFLSEWWTSSAVRDRHWAAPRDRINVVDKDLQSLLPSGVAFHHAGLSIEDRNAIEKNYLAGELQVICCTSTLAVGVNLPCHMAIIKNTVVWQSNIGTCKEYSDLEIMQMLGRAGRPQFDTSAIGVIMTRLEQVNRYERMISGQETLESCLHRNLIDHLNAEIGLGTITSPSSAKKWLMGTFLYVRLKDNPEHYKIEGDAPGRDLEERLENICEKGLALLQQNDLIRSTPKLQCSEFGDAMARYYVQFGTMQTFMAMGSKSKISEILSAISQAAEFKDVRLRAGEKTAYKNLNKHGSIKFPIPVNIDLSAHKVSLVIQSTLGCIDLPAEDQKHRPDYNSAKAIIFQHVHRLIRCIVDCQLYLEDAVSTRNALMLARSLGAQVWDDSPLHMKQLEGVGPVAVRKLVLVGIKTIEELDASDAHRIETAVSRNPPFGAQLQAKVKAFPKLRVSIKSVGEPIVKEGEYVKVNAKAEIGFLNENVPLSFNRKPVYVCLVLETSDGRLVHFARISAKKLGKGEDVLFSAQLVSPTQSIRAYVMCDQIAGTLRHANLTPNVAPGMFTTMKAPENAPTGRPIPENESNCSKRRASANPAYASPGGKADEFEDDDLDDADFVMAEAGFRDIDEFEHNSKAPAHREPKRRKTDTIEHSKETWQPQQLANGKWACNHPCKDKSQCKHLCCREGLDKRPKPPKSKEDHKASEADADTKQPRLNLPVSKKTPANPAKQAPAPLSRKTDKSKEASSLNRLHGRIQPATAAIALPRLGRAKPSVNGTVPRSNSSTHSRLSFIQAAKDVENEDGSDYGTVPFESDDLPEIERLVRSRPDPHADHAEVFDDEMLDTTETEQGVASRLPDFHADQNDTGDVDLSLFTDPRSDLDDTLVRFHDPLDCFDETGANGGMPTESPEMTTANDARSIFVEGSPDPVLQDYTMPTEQHGEVEAVLDHITDGNLVVQDAALKVPPRSPDAGEKFFAEFFGTELFNYIG